MSEFVAEELNPLEQELAKITSPVERAAFRFFFEATKKEGLDILPGYTWDQFKGGIAPFNDTKIDDVDAFVQEAQLVPNYTLEMTERNKLSDIAPPMLTALDGPFIRAIHREREKRAVRVLAIHPSMATPFIIARCISAAYLAEYGEDIRSSIYSVAGAYPTVMKYNLRMQNGLAIPVSPVDFGRSLNNVVLTAPKTANTATDNEMVNEWMRAQRAVFKVRNREVLSEPGNIEIVHPSGRRGLRSVAKIPPLHHIEYRPDANVSYITDVAAPTFIVGVADNLLNEPNNPSSIVRVVGDPEAWVITEADEVIAALRHSARLSSHGRESYNLEGWKDQEIRHARELARRVLRRGERDVE